MHEHKCIAQGKQYPHNHHLGEGIEQAPPPRNTPANHSLLLLSKATLCQASALFTRPHIPF